MKSKKGQSELITTVLLILVSIVAAGIVLQFVVPFVKNKLNSGDCTNTVGKIEISSSEFTCYNSSSNKMNVQVHVGDIGTDLEGIVIELGGASSSNFKIKNNTDIAGASMYGGATTLILPLRNQEKTYSLASTEIPTSVRVYSILKNEEICGVSDSLTSIDLC
jgi:flagellin-like protein